MAINALALQQHPLSLPDANGVAGCRPTFAGGPKLGDRPKHLLSVILKLKKNQIVFFHMVLGLGPGLGARDKARDRMVALLSLIPALALSLSTCGCPIGEGLS